MARIDIEKLKRFAVLVGRKVRRVLRVELDDKGYWLIEYIRVEEEPEQTPEQTPEEGAKEPEKKYKTTRKVINQDMPAMGSWDMFHFLQSISDSAIG